MTSQDEIKEFIETLFPLYRSICSPGLDEALERIRRRFIPELKIEEYPTGSSAWTWELPRKWELKEGYLEENGRRIVHTSQEPLCVWSGSLPVDKTVTFDELKEHVYTEPERPDLLCWYFRYYGKLDWGFNLPFGRFNQLDRTGRYKVYVDARYYDDVFRIGSAYLAGETEKTVLITSDICHPFQCNDSLSGAAVSYQLFQYLQNRLRHYSYIFNFVPETIGTIAFLAHHEGLLSRIVYHVYSEFWGNEGEVRLQKSLKGDSILDEIATEVLRRRYGTRSPILPFREEGIINDEIVTSMPNLFIPSIALNRGMFPQYHSHRDTPENLNYKNIEEGFQIVKEMIDRLETCRDIDHERERGAVRLGKFSVRRKPPEDFVPVPLFKGPIFLSKHDLWVDWRLEPELNEALDLIMVSLDGQNSVSEIAAFAKLPFKKVLSYLQRFEERGLVSREPVKSAVS